MKLPKEKLAQLESRAHALTPAYVVSMEGVKANIVWGLSHQWGMVKIQFSTTRKPELLEMANELAAKTKSEILFVHGNYVVYYRKHPNKPIDDFFR